MAPSAGHLTLQVARVAPVNEAVVVTAEVGGLTVSDPDASQRVLVSEELLDANPGRAGAPVSIPGIPIETASGGIKAPQYFVAGVAGDHGEPIAQYVGGVTIRITKRDFVEMTEGRDKEDDLAKWLKHRRGPNVCVPPSQQVQAFARKIGDYVFTEPRFYQRHGTDFAEGADAWLIAQAAINGAPW